MQAQAKFGKPVIESVVITMTADQAKFLHRFLAGTTSNTVVEATNLKYNTGSDDLIYAINDALGDLYDGINELRDQLGLPEYYIL